MRQVRAKIGQTGTQRETLTNDRFDQGTNVMLGKQFLSPAHTGTLVVNLMRDSAN